MIKNIGFCITGCFCAINAVIPELEKLAKKYNITPIITPEVDSISTRFGKSDELKETLERITQNTIITNLVQAEPTGPANKFDAIVIAPTTGNTLAKIANGINDNAVTMAVKAHIRNNKPVIIGISTNDALGANLENIAKLLQTKNIYFIPFNQDDYQKKPKSMASNWSKIEETIMEAEMHKQIQPIIER